MASGTTPSGRSRRGDAPVARKRGGGRRGKEPPAQEPAPGRRDLVHYGDAALFVVIMLVAALLAYALIPVAFADRGTQQDRDLGEITTNTNQVLLGATSPMCTYTNSRNIATEYHDARVHYLLSEDLYIRTEGKKDLNLGSLRGGIEKSVADLAGRLVPEGHGFVITVTVHESGQGFCLVRQAPGEETVFDADPNHEVVKDIIGSKNGHSFAVRSEFQQRDGGTCVITFAIFGSGAYDTGPLGGG